MARTPTVLIRIPATQAEAAQSATGLPQGPAVRLLLEEAIAARKQPVTPEDHAEAAIGHIRRLVEEGAR